MAEEPLYPALSLFTKENCLKLQCLTADSTAPMPLKPTYNGCAISFSPEAVPTAVTVPLVRCAWKVSGAIAAHLAVVFLPLPRWTSAALFRDGEHVPVLTSSGFSAVTNGDEELRLGIPALTSYETEIEVIVPSPTGQYEVLVTATLTATAGVHSLNATASGMYLTLLLPEYEAVCSNSNDCENSGVVLPLSFQMSYTILNTLPAGWTMAGLQSRSMSCPPSCFVNGTGGGVQYISFCTGYEYGANCLLPESAHTCAFGAGSDCKPCPDNALCPGGFQAWPLRGYWTPDDRSGNILRCPEPATSRCLGWSDNAEQVQCGQGYDEATPLCGACTSGYYSQDGRCLPCDQSGGSIDFALFLPLVYLGGGLAVMFLGVGGLLHWGFLRSKLPVSPGLAWTTAMDFVVWIMSTLQILMQLSRIQTPNLPSQLRALFNLFQLLEGDATAVVPHECVSTPPLLFNFITAGVGMGATILAWVCGVLVYRKYAAKQLKSRVARISTRIAYAAWVVAFLVYSVCIGLAFSVLDCVESSHVEYHSDGTMTSTMETVWSRDTRIKCYEGDHATAMYLSFAALAVVGLGLPAAAAILPALLVRQKRREFGSTPVKVSDDEKKNIESKEPSVPSFWSLPRPLHDELRNDRAWSPVFDFGQPWLRAASLALVFFSGAVSSLIPIDSHAMTRCIVLSVVLLAAAVALAIPKVKTDHRWAEWRKFPRAAVYATTCLLVVMQTALVESAATDPTGSAPLPAAVLVLVWVVFSCCLGMPLLLVLSLLRWFFSLVGCCCCRPSAARSSKLVSFLSAQRSEGAVRSMVLRYSAETLAEHVAAGTAGSLPVPDSSEAARLRSPSMSPLLSPRARLFTDDSDEDEELSRSNRAFDRTMAFSEPNFRVDNPLVQQRKKAAMPALPLPATVEVLEEHKWQPEYGQAQWNDASYYGYDPAGGGGQGYDQWYDSTAWGLQTPDAVPAAAADVAAVEEAGGPAHSKLKAAFKLFMQRRGRPSTTMTFEKWRKAQKGLTEEEILGRLKEGGTVADGIMTRMRQYASAIVKSSSRTRGTSRDDSEQENGGNDEEGEYDESTAPPN